MFARPGAMSAAPSEQDLRFYYFGLYRALRRYRTFTLIGWLIVLAGCASLPLGWSLGRVHGIVDLGLSFCTIAAGLALVSSSISSLEAYLRMRLPDSGAVDVALERSPVIDEILALMEDIDRGGWQEAYTAIGRMREMEAQFGLPPLDEK